MSGNLWRKKLLPYLLVNLFPPHVVNLEWIFWFQVEKYIYHESHRGVSQSYEYDIALMLLKKNITYDTMFVLPVYLDFEDDNYPSDESLANQTAMVSFRPNPTHGGWEGEQVKSFVLKYIYSFIDEITIYEQAIKK